LLKLVEDPREYLTITFGTPRTLRVGLVAIDPLSQLQKHGCRVFVSGHGLAKRQKPKVLKHVVDSKEPMVTC
jgi:hypothetical protein